LVSGICIGTCPSSISDTTLGKRKTEIARWWRSRVTTESGWCYGTRNSQT